MSKEEVLTKEDLRKAAWRRSTGISTFNHETQLAPPTLFPVYSCLWKMYPDDKDLEESCLNYICYCNTIPWTSSSVIGAALGIEDEGGISPLDAVNDFKAGLMGPLAGIDDTIGRAMIPTIFGPIVANMGVEGNPLGIFLWAAFAFVFPVVRILQYEQGHGIGVNVIIKFDEQTTAFTEACSVLGLTVVGSLVTTAVKLSTGLQFKSGDVVMKVQELIDGVVPALLPVAAVGVMYHFTRVKKAEMIWVILFIIVASTIGAATGIFTAQKERTDIEGCDLCRRYHTQMCRSFMRLC